MNYKILFLLFVSAVLLAQAFFFPALFAWCIFIFLIPVFYCALQFPRQLNFKHGFWWGILFFGFHLSGIAFLVFEHGNGNIRFASILFLFFYFSLYSIAWFGLTTHFVLKNKDSTVRIVLCWLFSTFVFFYIIKFHSMWIFGIYNGYCFGSPLVVFAEYPWLLSSLSTFGEFGLFLLLIIGQMSIALALTEKNYKYLMGLLSFAPFFVGYTVPSIDTILPSYVHTIGYVAPPLLRDPLEKARHIDFQIAGLLNKFPHIKHIIMPESSLSLSINCYPELIERLTTHSRNKDINLFIGAYRKDKEKRYNSLYLIRNGMIKNYYDKQLRMPFMEYVPFPWNYCSGFKDLFLKNWNGFEISQNSVNQLRMTPQLTLIPCICSELFLGSDEKFCNFHSTMPILVVTNDAWFSTDYLKHLMFLYARFKSILYKKDVIFVSHTKGYWIGKDCGICMPLIC